ncbi:methyltransferase domain-containing protein [Paenibacillus sp. LMG 31459]|jgi:SAM-dependent methyltransferase|uniref:Methyltransferase domain-containing protein n=1 Tax=Paenibacillus phytohabitans TaxID=2654978 RepID=A0ABX1YL43_9BACL|nr:class I SAM-dependent methyltransferase [Paenibacillus phytohabitans]NOU81239.1 methyltransferase domain-containing protein [Paenibacillus phytohabitans]
MYREIEVKDFLPVLLEQLKFSESILDIGSGTGTLLERYEAAVVLGLDIHRPYLLHRKYKSPHIIPVHADASHIDKLFLPGTFSAVTLIDSLEHFSMREGTELLRKAEIIASNRVVVFTPRGFFPQEGKDHFNLHGEYYQKHWSGWEPEDFLKLGYAVTVLKGYHHAENPSFREAFGEDHAPLDALLACKTV